LAEFSGVGHLNDVVARIARQLGAQAAPEFVDSLLRKHQALFSSFLPIDERKSVVPL
jgi:hypothetical protein